MTKVNIELDIELAKSVLRDVNSGIIVDLKILDAMHDPKNVAEITRRVQDNIKIKEAISKGIQNA